MLQSTLNHLLDITKTARKLWFQNQDISCLFIKYDMNALKVVYGFISCDWDWHFLSKKMHSRQVLSLQGLFDILDVVRHTLRENSDCLLKLPCIICIQSQVP